MIYGDRMDELNNAYGEDDDKRDDDRRSKMATGRRNSAQDNELGDTDCRMLKELDLHHWCFNAGELG